jgi:hypothetical protein
VDGTTKDSVKRGRLFRLASQKYAVETFPAMIVEMSKKKASIHPIEAADGLHEVVVRSYSGPTWNVRYEDYLKCLSVLERLGPGPAFPSHPDGYLEQAKLLVEVEFSDRSQF